MVESTRLEDTVLVEQAKNGNTDAFGQLVQRYQSAVYGVAFNLVRNFADAQDLTQEAFLEAYKVLPTLQNPERFAPWLFSITQNRCKMWLRRKKPNVIEIHFDSDSSDLECQLDPNPTPDREIIRNETYRAVMQAIEKLPEKNRLVLTMYYLDGLSYQEIATFLDVSVSTVQSRLQRARGQLREEILEMATDLFDEYKLKEDFSQKVIHKIGEFGMTGSGNWAKLFENETARQLYLSIYPEGQLSAPLARRLGISKTACTRLVSNWEKVGFVSRNGNKVVAKIPIYTEEDILHFQPWLKRTGQVIYDTVARRIDEYRQLASEMATTAPVNPDNLLTIFLSSHTLTPIIAKMDEQYQLNYSIPQRGELGAFVLCGYDADATGKYQHNIGINLLPGRNGLVLALLNCEEKVNRKVMWAFAKEWFNPHWHAREGYPMVNLLSELSSLSCCAEDAQKLAMDVGFSSQDTVKVIEALIEVGFLSDSEPHQVLIPYFNAVAHRRIRRLADVVVDQAVEGIGNPKGEFESAWEKCRFAQCNFADVFAMLFVELKGWVIQRLLEIGLLPPLPKQANAEWGAWLEERI
jgi:RNA polymerase sigma-70 factor (ECF subfamily)